MLAAPAQRAQRERRCHALGVMPEASARRLPGPTAKGTTWQAEPERDAEIVRAMRSAILALAIASTSACGGGAGSPGVQPAAQPGADPADGGPGGPTVGGGAGAGLASVTFEPLDGSGDCAGLVPDRAPPPVEIRVPAPAGAACVGGTSDGTGAVAVGVRDAAGATTWHAYAPDGAARGAFGADPPLLPQPSGWHAVVSSGPQGAAAPKVELVAFSPDGSATRRETVSPDPAQAQYFRWNLARDPAGGSLVVVRSSTVAGNHWSSVTAQRFDASGAPAWPGAATVRIVPSPTEPLFLLGGVSSRGEALVVSQHSAFVDVSWTDPRSGAPIAAASADEVEPAAGVVGAGLAPALESQPLLDGSIAIRANGTFRRIYAPLGTASSPLPEWLAPRGACTVRATRGAAGYAALPPPAQGSADCAQRVDLLSPSGRLCGRAVLHETGGACTTGAVDQGWDGTVVQQSARDACTYFVWPRLLGR